MSSTPHHKYMLGQVDAVLLATQVETVTFDVVQAIFLQMYQSMRVGPVYLFLAKDDYTALDTEAKQMIGEDTGEKAIGRMDQIVNQATGRIVHLVELSEIEPHLLMFGFFQKSSQYPSLN